MKKHNIFLILFLYLFITGCTSISYSPSVALEVSPYTINGIAQMNELKDISNPESKQKVFAGISVTEPNTLSGKLSTEVTNAIINDFSMNGVFDRISKKTANPDYIIDGEIQTFYGKTKVNTLGWLTLPISTIWYFGLPIYNMDGSVVIKLIIKDKFGTVIGTYTGSSSFTEKRSIYRQPGLEIPTKVNKAFSNTVEQIRAEIMYNRNDYN